MIADLNTYDRLTLQRIPLNRGGYDRHGAYYGVGRPLYFVTDGIERIEFRAVDRAEAKAHVSSRVAGARFYN